MCDLIDLNSPDRKALLSSRLASPLIPVPTDNVCGNNNTRTNDPRSLLSGKRDSLENNPFDMVLHKTTEYIQKKDDPFEVTLEKALELKCKRSAALRTCSLDLTEDQVFKQKTSNEKLKLNKTLDESIINDELNKNHASINNISKDNIIGDLSNTNILSDVIKSDNVIPIIEVKDVDLSILNQSVMNDTLFEEDKELSNDQLKFILPNKELTRENIEKGKVISKIMPLVTESLKVPKLRRSLSQGEALSPKKSKQYLNQTSLVQSLRLNSNSDTVISSANSLDVLNEGFLRSHCSGSSVFSSISNISSITRLNSASFTNSSSLMVSNGTINRTFLESCSSDKSEYTRLSDNVNPNKEIRFSLPETRKYIGSTGNVSTRSSMSDLIDRLNKLKAKSDIQISVSPAEKINDCTYSPGNNVKECETILERNEKTDTNNKLIDVDVFIPENNCSKEQCRNSGSDTSSDSVFIDGTIVSKSIFQEAKLLARTFEELALRTSSGSSIDDLITNNPLWTSELLPAFDDEASAENLIELPTSPDAGSTKPKVPECVNNNVDIDKKEDLSNKIQDKVKELEMELVEPTPTEKRLTVATLLLDLKKLIGAENNVEVNKLLEDLEKALGINCESNTELLATYLNIPNNLEKSPQNSSSSLEVKNNVAGSNIEYSHENNLSNDSTDGVNFNDGCTSKYVDNQKYVKDVNGESKCETIEAQIDAEKLKDEKAEKLNKSPPTENSSSNGESNDLLNGRAVIELLTNIAKLLSGQTKENPTLDLVKNLGNVLNYATNNCSTDKDAKNDNSCTEIQQTPRKSKLKVENKTRSSLLSNSTNRLSLDLESKKQPTRKNFLRRSISVSQTPLFKRESTAVMSSSKSTSQLKDATKRFPSDPGFVSPTISKKVIINNQKNEQQKEAQVKPVAKIELPKEKTSTISAVKNKFKKKFVADIVNKKGPMKAIHPIGNMHKRESISKKIPTPVDTITPPKTHKIISSTPNSNNGSTVIKSRSSKPVASSTPDAQTAKARKIQVQVITSPKKRNFSCDISPVSTRVNVHSNGTTNSPRRHSKLPSPKKTTPRRKPTESGIPKSQTPPMYKRLNSSFDINQYERMNESPQRSIYKTSNSQKNSPITLKINENNTQRSPLRDNNKLTHKVKPVNLISKLRRHSVGTNMMEKENNYI